MTLSKILSSLGVRSEQPLNPVAPTQTAIELNETDLGSIIGGYRKRHGHHHGKRHHHRRHHGHHHHDYDDCDDCDYGDDDDCDDCY
ncbi:hypothetical protein [Dictyobacter formicarum]|uniref:Uncharacterized protein n=1 Tax=Dictyobacter formicarum TaxID=2778368 RepID=A0ABQ3VH27_9CHLR|nr:hypothetical protein [Dictyobacter formicarum]GHO84981.1 hypothetical protein KSZ_29870 [Dictyobacter formicarum]